MAGGWGAVGGGRKLPGAGRSIVAHDSAVPRFRAVCDETRLSKASRMI